MGLAVGLSFRTVMFLLVLTERLRPGSDFVMLVTEHVACSLDLAY